MIIFYLKFQNQEVKLLNVKEFILKLARIFKKTESESIDENVLVNLLDRISKLEKRQQELEESLCNKMHCVEKIIVENMHADKVEFNLDAIDVKELSGMLSIGLNYEGKLVKIHSHESAKKTKDKEEINSNRERDQVSTQRPKINMFFGT